MADLYLALLHHPVYDKNGAVVTTAVTNMDVHDLARMARTFGLVGVFVTTPVETLRRLVERIMLHWDTGPGAAYNRTRKEALALVRLAPDLEAPAAGGEREGGPPPARPRSAGRGRGARVRHPAARSGHLGARRGHPARLRGPADAATERRP